MDFWVYPGKSKLCCETVGKGIKTGIYAKAFYYCVIKTRRAVHGLIHMVRTRCLLFVWWTTLVSQHGIHFWRDDGFKKGSPMHLNIADKRTKLTLCALCIFVVTQNLSTKYCASNWGKLPSPRLRFVSGVYIADENLNAFAKSFIKILL